MELTAPSRVATTARRDFSNELRVVAAVAHRELIRSFRARSRMVMGALQPLIFLVVMGYGLGSLTGQSDGADLKQFLLPGMMAMSIVTTSVSNGVSLVWDREFGFMSVMAVAPPSRAALVAGRVVGGALVATLQGAIMLPIAPVVGLHVTPALVGEVVVASLLIALALTSFGVLLASRVKKMQTFQVVLQVTLLPMLFLSGAMFPLQGLPGWLEAVTRLNPLTYAIDPLRRIVVDAQHWPPAALARYPPSVELFGHRLPVSAELGVLVLFAAVFTWQAARSFGRPD